MLIHGEGKAGQQRLKRKSFHFDQHVDDDDGNDDVDDDGNDDHLFERLSPGSKKLLTWLVGSSLNSLPATCLAHSHAARWPRPRSFIMFMFLSLGVMVRKMTMTITL